MPFDRTYFDIGFCCMLYEHMFLSDVVTNSISFVRILHVLSKKDKNAVISLMRVPFIFNK